MLTLIIIFFFLCRYYHHFSLNCSIRHGHLGAGVRYERAAWPEILSDTAHGAHGQAWRHLETARFGCIRT